MIKKKLTEQEQIAKALIANANDTEESVIAHVVVSIPDFISLKFIQFGRPNQLLAEFSRQLGQQSDICDIYVYDLGGKLLASKSVTTSKLIAYERGTWVQYRLANWFGRIKVYWHKFTTRLNPADILKRLPSKAYGINFCDYTTIHLTNGQRPLTLLQEGKTDDCEN